VREYLTLLKRELKSITKEKTIMFAVLVQFFIASFSSVIMVGIMAFYDPSSISENTKASITVGLVGKDAHSMEGFLTEKNNVHVAYYNNMSSAETDFKVGRINAILEIPLPKSDVVDMKLVLPEMDTQQTVVLMALQEPLKNYENYLRMTNGVNLKYSGFNGKPANTWEFLYSIVIPVLMLFPSLIAGSIMIDSVSEEFENKTFDTLMAAPVSLKQIFAAKVSSAIITAVLQVCLWAGLLRLNGLVIQNLAIVLGLATVVAAAISFIAAFVALYFKDRERAQFIYSMILVVLVSGSAFLGPSPISLITRVASGVPNAGILTVAIYPLALAAIGFIFFKFSRKLVFSK
jgi:ABC-type Na+ efflux pump permease subunit